MLSRAELGLTTRYKLKIPFIFFMLNSSLEFQHAARTLNISRRGIFFVTEHPLSVGLPVRLLLQMPSKCGGKPATRIVMTGRVSHIPENWRGQSGSGVGVE